MSRHAIAGRMGAVVASIAAALASGPLEALADEAVAAKAEPWLKRLDPVSRTKVLMALLALLLLGGLLIAIAVLWARHTRRKIREPLPASRIHDEDWYNKPLVPKPPDEDVDEPD